MSASTQGKVSFFRSAAVLKQLGLQLPSGKVDKWSKEQKDVLIVAFEKARQSFETEYIELLVSRGVEKDVVDVPMALGKYETVVGSPLRRTMPRNDPMSTWGFPKSGDVCEVLDEEYLGGGAGGRGWVNFFTKSVYGVSGTSFVRSVLVRDSLVNRARERTAQRDGASNAVKVVPEKKVKVVPEKKKKLKKKGVKVVKKVMKKVKGMK